jgi:hypothetical protein
MKKFPGKVIMQMVLLERYFAKHLEEQGKNKGRKKLPPQPVKLGPVLTQGVAAEQEVFRNKKSRPAGFGRFSARNGGRERAGFFYVPGEFRKAAEQYAGKQDKKEET